MLWVLFLSLIRGYQKYKEVEQEKEAERLKNNLRSHYQSLVKNRLIEEIIRNIMLALEAEEQRIDKIINTAKQRTEQTIAEVRSSQSLLQTRIDGRKKQQNELSRDLNDLQKLKRIWSRTCLETLGLSTTKLWRP